MTTPLSVPPLIDSHVHVFTRGMPFSPTAWCRPDYEFTAEQCLATLDAHGVASAVIAACSLFGDYNDYTRWAVRTYPRLRGTVIVEPTISADALATMKREGIVGVRFQWHHCDIPDLESFEYQVFFSRLRALGLHVHLNINPERVHEVLPALASQGVRLVLDHMGHPTGGLETLGFQATLRALAGGNTWVKLSGAYRLAEPAEQIDAYVGALAAVDRTRLLWGSDAPFIGVEKTAYGEVIAQFDRWTADAGLRAQIARNAFDFYFLN